MKAFSPEAVYKVNWALRNIDYPDHAKVSSMTKALFLKRSVAGITPIFDIPEHWTPIVHSAIWGMGCRAPEVRFIEASEQDGALLIEFVCNPDHKEVLKRILSTCNNRLDIITQNRLKMAESSGLLEGDKQ